MKFIGVLLVIDLSTMTMSALLLGWKDDQACFTN